MPEAEREVSGRRLQKERTSAMLYSERQHARSSAPAAVWPKMKENPQMEGYHPPLCSHRGRRRLCLLDISYHRST